MLKKRVLVTGGAGFLGSHLCEALLREGHEVLCLDNFFTGRRHNVLHLRHDPHFELMRTDVCQPFDHEVDEIYHLACPASPIHYQTDPVQTIKINVMGSIHALELARRKRAKILQASTSEVYGDPLVHPQKETHWGNVNPTGPRACYDEGKRCAETLCFDYHRAHGVRIKVGRIFNTYGPRMHPNDGRVISNFVLRALRGEPLEICGDGSQTRSFCFVRDLIDGLLRLMNTEDHVTGPVNLGCPGEISMLDLARLVLELTGSRSQLVFTQARPDEPKRRNPDISIARQVLAWQPTTTLREGLVEVIEYFSGRNFSQFT